MAAPALVPTPAAAPRPPLHTISLFVNNKPGVLVRVCLVFSRRGFNIESLVVSAGAEGRFSRMTIVCSGNAEDLDQIIKQLAKLVDVVHAIDHTGDESYETEIALVKLFAPLDSRTAARDTVASPRLNAAPSPPMRPRTMTRPFSGSRRFS